MAFNGCEAAVGFDYESHCEGDVAVGRSDFVWEDELEAAVDCVSCVGCFCFVLVLISFKLDGKHLRIFLLTSMRTRLSASSASTISPDLRSSGSQSVYFHVVTSAFGLGNGGTSWLIFDHSGSKFCAGREAWKASTSSLEGLVVAIVVAIVVASVCVRVYMCGKEEDTRNRWFSEVEKDDSDQDKMRTAREG